jgi:hypothetical protein
MRLMQLLAGAMLTATLSGTARAGPVDDLTASGFVVVKTTKVIGDFDGCDRDRKVPLKGGGVFTCSGFGYMHAQNPTATLLKSKDGAHYKLVINDAVFDGAFS